MRASRIFDITPHVLLNNDHVFYDIQVKEDPDITFVCGCIYLCRGLCLCGWVNVWFGECVVG